MIADTNALSAAANGDPATQQIFSQAERMAVPVIVLGEYRFGIQQSRHRQAYEQWLSAYLDVCEILEISDQTTLSYAAIRSELRAAGTPIPSNDVWIAALCRQHSLPLLSRDTHFDRVRGLRRLNW